MRKIYKHITHINNMINLDTKDKKLLTALDENSRYTNSHLAKKIGLSKPAIEYRIKRLQKNDIIFKYYTVINVTKLGYSQYKIYFKFQNTSPQDEQKITDYWTKERGSVWVGQIRGRWDLAVSLLCKSNFEFGQTLSSFMNKFSKFILEKDVLLTEYSPIYQREYLEKAKQKEFTYGIPEQVYKLDEIDTKILQTLSNNARIPIIELAEKTGLTRDIINYRLKKLTTEGIIDQYRCYLNLENININQYKIILRTKNFNKEAEEEIKDYIAKHKKATQFLKLIGSWDLEIEFETENEDELYEILNNIRNKFSDIIRDFDILRITKTFKLNYFPF